MNAVCLAISTCGLDIFKELADSVPVAKQILEKCEEDVASARGRKMKRAQ